MNILDHIEDHNYSMGLSICKSPLANAKPFPEPDANQPTPAPVENVPTSISEHNTALDDESVDGWVSDDCSIYSPSNSSQDDLESDDESCNTLEERKFIVFESQFLSLLKFCPQCTCGKIITTKKKNTQGSMLIVKRVSGRFVS